MGGKDGEVSLSIRFLERYLASKPSEPLYSWCRELYEHNSNEIIGRYGGKASKIIESFSVEAKIRTADLCWIEMNLTGPMESVKKVLEDHVFINSMPPPETKIVIPLEGTGAWGSSEEGYKLAEKMLLGMGHQVKKDGKILRKGFEC